MILFIKKENKPFQSILRKNMSSVHMTSRDVKNDVISRSVMSKPWISYVADISYLDTGP